MISRGSAVYWCTGRTQADIDAENDRAYARRRHTAFLRELGLDSDGVDGSVRAMRAARLHAADDDDPSRAWVAEALAANPDAERVWVDSGSAMDELHDGVRRGFSDERPDAEADRATSFVLGVLVAV